MAPTEMTSEPTDATPRWPARSAPWNNKQGIAMRRLAAFSVDWALLALWGLALFGAVTIATGGVPPRAASPWQSQLVGLVAMTIPFVLYFAISESAAARASLGKRLLGLSVSTERGERLAFPRAFARNALKFLPWECGHTVAHQAIYSEHSGLDTWVWAPAAVAFGGPVWWMLAILCGGRAPYDRWTSVLVTRSNARTLAGERLLAARPDEAGDDRPRGAGRPRRSAAMSAGVSSDLAPKKKADRPLRAPMPVASPAWPATERGG